MPFNGSGSFVPLAAPNFPEVTNTTISSTYMNAVLNDLFTGLTNTITRDGESPATSNIPMGGHKLTGLADATASGDALANQQLTAAWVGGNWGVGAAPSVLLDAQKSQNATTQGRIFNASALASGLARFAVQSDTATLLLDAFSSGSANPNQVWVGNSTANPLIFGIGGAEKGRFHSDGKFGIGGTPTFLVHLKGTGSTPILATTSTDASGGTTFLQANSSIDGRVGNSTNLPFQLMVNSAVAATLDTSGNFTLNTVGSGFNIISSNTYGFTQQMTNTVGNGGILIKNSAGSRVLEILALGSTNPGFYGASAGDLSYNANSGRHVFGTVDVGRVWINNSGLGIGAAAGQRLQIASGGSTTVTPTNISGLTGAARIDGSVAGACEDGITFASGGGGGAAISLARGNSFDTAINFYTNATSNAVAGGFTKTATLAGSGAWSVAGNSQFNTGGTTMQALGDGGGATWSTSLPIGTLISGSRSGGAGIIAQTLGSTLVFDGTNFVTSTAPSGATTNVQYGTWRALGQLNATFGIWVRTA